MQQILNRSWRFAFEGSESPSCSSWLHEGSHCPFLFYVVRMCMGHASFGLIEHVTPESHQPQLRRQNIVNLKTMKGQSPRKPEIS